MLVSSVHFTPKVSLQHRPLRFGHDDDFQEVTFWPGFPAIFNGCFQGRRAFLYEWLSQHDTQLAVKKNNQCIELTHIGPGRVSDKTVLSNIETVSATQSTHMTVSRNNTSFKVTIDRQHYGQDGFYTLKTPELPQPLTLTFGPVNNLQDDLKPLAAQPADIKQALTDLIVFYAHTSQAK